MSDDELLEKLVKQKIEVSGPYFDFCGDDGCNDGNGHCSWCPDGPESSRCCCGNRRVCWVLNADKTDVYPEAY